MLALSIDVFHSAYIIFGYYNEFIHFAGITYPFPFLYGPIFYIYARLISEGSISFKPKYYLHFVPFMLVAIYGMLFVYLQSNDFKLALIRGELEKPVPGLKITDILKPVHGIIYTFLTIKVVRDYNKKIRNTYSSIEKINLNWLRHLTIGLSTVWVVVVISYILDAVLPKNVEMDHLIYMTASIVIYTIGYLSLRQPEIFHQAYQPENKTEAVSKMIKDEGVSYKRSGLTDVEAQNHLKNLLRLMETEKPYLNNELTLRDLSDKLAVSPHNLSEILNTRLKQNFYDFVNNYRVEEVKRRMADIESAKFSLLAIAFDSGFNSKAAFNTIFKKYTGLTPSQYRNQFK